MSGQCGVITNPERALWQMVLFQAINEALHGPKGVHKPLLGQLWQEARDYITTPSEDLAMVCAMAGVEMDAVIDRMRLRLTNKFRSCQDVQASQETYVLTGKEKHVWELESLQTVLN